MKSCTYHVTKIVGQFLENFCENCRENWILPKFDRSLTYFCAQITVNSTHPGHIFKFVANQKRRGGCFLPEFYPSSKVGKNVICKILQNNFCSDKEYKNLLGIKWRVDKWRPKVDVKLDVEVDTFSYWLIMTFSITKP